MPPTLKGNLKRAAAVLVLAASAAFLVYYWRAHPEVGRQLRHINPLLLLGLVALYLMMTAILAGLYDTMLRMSGKPIAAAENILLTMYSSIINFFGPLQSGPGFRALYLKRKHGVSIKAFTGTALLYYGLFAAFNVAFLIFGVISLRFAPFVALALILIAWLIWQLLFRLPVFKRYKTAVNGRLFSRLALLTLAQALLVVVIYSIELHSIGVHASLSQAIVYAGAANLALFVSLTPGALGFRESFLYLSQHLHHISNSSIVAASVLDRAAYIVYLGVLLVIILSFHVGKRLDIKAVRNSVTKE